MNAGLPYIQYALNHWPSLIYYCSDGRAEIDNLIAERALRGVAIGRRNYLFAGADTGGERAAAMYSLIGSARLNGLDPEAYLAYVLDRIADHPAIALTNCCRGTWRRRCRLLLASPPSDSIRGSPRSTTYATVLLGRLRLICKFF
ncbi:hypothetical protein WI73_20235 [Burkholderia ubonensis]|nr:hypothetical protein WI36_09975 [Burkholderia ubonensis]KVC65808.1 hypothetical protein WI73_20235 [Burkholderia ubonensis]